MKKIILFLSVFTLGGICFAQSMPSDHTRVHMRPQDAERIWRLVQQQAERTDKAAVYENFDRYYYEHAYYWAKKGAPNREGPIEYLQLIKQLRSDLYSDGAYMRLGDYLRNRFEQKTDELKTKYVFSYNDNKIFQWYSSRPATRAVMLKNMNAYEEYDALVYENIKNRLQTKHAKAYLEQAGVLRKEFVTSGTHEGYADLRRILDKAKGYEFADTMSLQERGLIEDYLTMQLPVEGIGVVMPLDDFFTAYRKSLSASQRRGYPTVHYK